MSDVREDLEYLSKEYEDGDYVDISAQNYFQDALDEIERLRNPPPCKWQLDPIGCVYFTSCGAAWLIESGINFCPECGHPAELTAMEVLDE